MDKKEKHQEEAEDIVIKEEEGQPVVQEVSGEVSFSKDSYAMKVVKQTIIDAVERKVSDVFIEPLEDALRIRYRVDGLLCKVNSFPPEYSSSVVSCVKVLSGLDIAEHRFPQDGRFRMMVAGRAVDFRVSILPANLGEKVVLRVLDKSNASLNLDELGFVENDIEILKRNLQKPYGMILVCGPTGSGKTTTLYSGLKFIDSIEANIVTVEDPIEFQLGGINQVAVNENLGLTFAAVLRSILRQDPDIIMIGEIRDFETADIAVKASLTGHLVLSTLHTTTATAAVVRFINMGIEPFLVASSCLVTASQALLRVLCERCKKESSPPESLIEDFRSFNLPLPQDVKYYTPQGCRFCNNTGFLGRVGIIEVMELDSELREMLIKKETESVLRNYAVKRGMKTLREKALHKVAEGLLTMEEAYRVTMGI